MKKSVKITFASITAALVSALMSASLIPNITFAVPAVAGLLMIPVFAQCGVIWALLSFFVSALTSFFISDKTSWLLFVCFFGFYPILKPLIEKIKKPVIEWTLKLLIFNSSAVICYFVEILIIDLKLKLWLLAAAFILGNIVFVLYDIAVSRVVAFYYLRLDIKISMILKG